jgi:hypothetical protein
MHDSGANWAMDSARAWRLTNGGGDRSGRGFFARQSLVLWRSENLYEM